MKDIESTCYEEIDKTYCILMDIMRIELTSEGDKQEIKNYLIRLFRQGLFVGFTQLKVGDMLPNYLGFPDENEIVE